MNDEEKNINALERVKELLDSAKNQGHIIVRVEDIENTFPKLQELEDDRIRKWLEELIEAMPDDSIEFKELKRIDVLHWLEKQGENKPTENESKAFDADKVIAWLVANIIDFEYYVRLFKKDFGL